MNWTAKRFEREYMGTGANLIGYQVVDDEGAVVFEAYPAPWPVHVKEEYARLGAAAPELLELLTAYVELEESAAPYSSSPMRERARAAIAKAQGRTP